jgi:surface protein
MFNIFDELSWPQFTQLPDVSKLPLNEQVQHYNQYLYDLNNARQNWIDYQNKGPLSTTPTPPTPPTSATFQVDTTQTTVGSTASDTFELPLTNNGVINFAIDWGDGNTDVITSYNQAETTHTYASSGVYEITITSGMLRGWSFAGSRDRNKLMEVYDWSVWDFNVAGAFRGCNNLISSATSIPTITGNALNNMFQQTTNFNGPLNGWDVSGVQNFQQMFLDASSFNQPLNNWVVSSATNMRGMFNGATAFDQNIGSWNVSNVTNIIEFMSSKTPSTFSTTNLNAIYNGWSLLSVQPNLTITFGTANYTATGAAGRAILDNAPNNWTITDGGQV